MAKKEQKDKSIVGKDLNTNEDVNVEIANLVQVIDKRDNQIKAIIDEKDENYKQLKECGFYKFKKIN